MPFNAPFPSFGSGTFGNRQSVVNPYAGVGGGGGALASAGQFGWADQGNGVYRKGQYTMTADELSAQLPRWNAIQQGSSAGSYGTGIDYQSAVSPYLSQSQQTQSGGASTVNQGNEYANQLKALMSNPDSIKDTGAYKFRFDQGQQALERSAAANGMTGSGNVLAELMKYGQGQASQAYDTEASRLASLSGAQNSYILGQMAAANQEMGSKTQANALMGTLALNARRAQSEDYWNANKLANDTGLSSGYLKQQAW